MLSQTQNFMVSNNKLYIFLLKIRNKIEFHHGLTDTELEI